MAEKINKEPFNSDVDIFTRCIRNPTNESIDNGFVYGLRYNIEL